MATFDLNTPEAWYDVPGFGSYKISSHLRLMSFHQGLKRRATTGRLIKIHTDDRGYRKLVLWRGKKYHNLYLHRVVAELVYGPVPEGMCVLHADDDKSNNWPENLRFGTMAENVADCKANGHFVTLRGEQRVNAKLNDLSVVAMRRLYSLGVCRPILAECFGVDPGAVAYILDGSRWGHVGEAAPPEYVVEGQ